MEDLPFNITDIVIVGLLVLSGIFAATRGFVKEVLSIVGWILAALGTLVFFPDLRPFAREYIEQTIIADSLTGVAMFVVILFVFSFIASFIANRVLESDLGMLDRSLGFLFGLVRGALLICLAYLALIQFIPPEEHWDWLAEARATPLIQEGAQMIASVAPDDLEDSLETGKSFIDKTREDVEKTGDAVQQLQKIVPDSDTLSGYTDEMRKQMDRLTGSKDN